MRVNANQVLFPTWEFLRKKKNLKFSRWRFAKRNFVVFSENDFNFKTNWLLCLWIIFLNYYQRKLVFMKIEQAVYDML